MAKSRTSSKKTTKKPTKSATAPKKVTTKSAAPAAGDSVKASKSHSKSSKKVVKKTASAKAPAAPAKPAPTKTPKAPPAPKVAAKVAPKVASTPPAAAPGKPRKIKTHLSAKELRHYRDLLLERRHEIVGDINGLEDSALRDKDASNLSNMPLHMADVGSDNYDQDLALGLMESERRLLNEIDEALDRIANKTYGVCAKTGQPINEARLEAKPWAKYTIEVARELERTGQRL